MSQTQKTYKWTPGKFYVHMRKEKASVIRAGMKSFFIYPNEALFCVQETNKNKFGERCFLFLSSTGNLFRIADHHTNFELYYELIDET